MKTNPELQAKMDLAAKRVPTPEVQYVLCFLCIVLCFFHLNVEGRRETDHRREGCRGDCFVRLIAGGMFLCQCALAFTFMGVLNVECFTNTPVGWCRTEWRVRIGSALSICFVAEGVRARSQLRDKNACCCARCAYVSNACMKAFSLSTAAPVNG